MLCIAPSLILISVVALELVAICDIFFIFAERWTIEYTVNAAIAAREVNEVNEVNPNLHLVHVF